MKQVLRLSCLLLLLTTPALAKSKPHAPARAPSFTLPTRDGTVALDSLRGGPVLVDFWASWCVPCRASFPWMATMQERYGPQGLRIVAINLDKERAAADAFLAKVPAPFVVAFDPAGTTAEAFRVRGMPSTFLVSRAGTIVSSHIGFDARKAPAFEALIREACTP